MRQRSQLPNPHGIRDQLLRLLTCPFGGRNTELQSCPVLQSAPLDSDVFLSGGGAAPAGAGRALWSAGSPPCLEAAESGGGGRALANSRRAPAGAGLALAGGGRALANLVAPSRGRVGPFRGAVGPPRGANGPSRGRSQNPGRDRPQPGRGSSSSPRRGNFKLGHYPVRGAGAPLTQTRRPALADQRYTVTKSDSVLPAGQRS